jgi:hypothetical protein
METELLNTCFHLTVVNCHVLLLDTCRYLSRVVTNHAFFMSHVTWHTSLTDTCQASHVTWHVLLPVTVGTVCHCLLLTHQEYRHYAACSSSVGIVTGLVVPCSASEGTLCRPPLQDRLWGPLISLITGTEVPPPRNKQTGRWGYPLTHI